MTGFVAIAAKNAIAKAGRPFFSVVERREIFRCHTAERFDERTGGRRDDGVPQLKRVARKFGIEERRFVFLELRRRR